MCCDNDEACIIFGSEKLAKDFMSSDPVLHKSTIPIRKIRLGDINNANIGFNLDSESYARFITQIPKGQREDMPDSIKEREEYFIEAMKN